jgi:hypothetical protein
MAQAVDPKELILNNKGLLVAYVLAILPVVLYFVIVGDLASQVETNQNTLRRKQNDLKGFHQQLSDPSNPLYTEQDKTRLEERQKLYAEELEALDAVVAERDAPLERWFDKYEGVDKPEFNEYVTEWEQNQVPELLTNYADLLGDNPKSLVFVDVPGRSELRSFQKRFWIQSAILDALKKGGAVALTAPGINFRDVKPGPGGAFSIVSVRISFEAVFTRLPLIVKRLLSTELTMRVAQLEVHKDSFEFARENMMIDGSRKVFLDFAYGEALKDVKPPEEPTAVIGEPTVRVEILLEVFDFGKSNEE